MTVAPAAKTVAVMQPYLFPYLGYYQLARAADEFVFLDDVGFIKQGYVNRNSVLLNGVAHRFTAPVRDASSFRPIAAHDYLPRWPSLHALLAQAYRRAPQWRAIEPLVHAVLDDPDDNVAHKNARSIRLVFDYLGVAGPRWSLASALDPEPTLRAQERVLALCAATGATTYVNSPGGRALYSGDDFAAHGVALRFLQMLPIAYDQGTPAFVANLSMLDVLAHCPRDEVVALLDRFELEA